MARSIGEAAATGLQAGLSLAFQINDRRDAKVRQERADAERMEDRTRTLQRQSLADADAADASQLATLQRTQQANADVGIQPSEAEVATLQGNMRTLQERAAGRATQRGGAPLTTETPDLTKQGADLSKFTGKQINAYLKEKTGFDGQGFVRDANGVSPVGAAFDAFKQGMDSGDMSKALPGVNTLLASQLNRIKGKPSPHGGTIVGAEVADLHPDPRSTQDDPSVVPMLKVYVSDKPTSSGDVSRENGAPAGATGWYLAPLTEGRGTGGDSPVKSLSVRQAMEHFGRYAQLEELINDTPEFRAKLEEGGISLADSRATLAQLGVKAPKRSVESKTTAIGPNGLLVQDTDTRTGQTTERVVSGTPKTPAKTGSVGALQQSVSAIKGLVDDGDITEAEGQARILSLLDKSTTGTKAQGLAKGGGSGGGKGGAAGQSLKEREQDRKELKDKFDRADKAADNAKAAADAAQAALRDHTREGAPRGKGSAVDAYNAGLAELKSAAKEARAKADTARKRADDMNTELDKPPAEPAKQPAGGKGAVLKFDKNGNRI